MNRYDRALFQVMSREEFNNKYGERFSGCRELAESLKSMRYCKAEVFRDCITGMIRLPKKNDLYRDAQLTFGFCLTASKIVFIENGGKIGPWIENQAEILGDAFTPGQLLMQVMGNMISDDILYLSHIEEQTEMLEDNITEGNTGNLFVSLTKYRRKLSELNAYYDQLVDIGELLQLPVCASFVSEPDDWDKYTRRCERLQNHVQFIRENLLQLGELYQSTQDAHQNRIMGFLTIITTFFLPLTLLTGWYGMNFRHMPELSWRYGYIAVIAVALIIAVCEFIYFKKKKYF
ncbi:MAG: CorA family divalent cation transporter [Eubacteriales bacterium]|nr:magnesium transporter [Clostridiales bacterium]MDD7307181.1 CorA family divalent cation transporter [Eubacteriales bacterium]MDY2934528.1 CorA family divalent cation transporter [Anaerovoracaceae bacterium]MEE0181246.1 CorA family divalent cation transporter [Anaerovoracaceae bacterium]